jgi:hypothetical protein
MNYKIQDSTWEAVATDLYNLQVQIKALEAQQAATKLALISLSAGQNSEAGPLRFTYSERKGSVDYTKIPELLNVDVEPYRKPSVDVWILKRLEEVIP